MFILVREEIRKLMAYAKNKGNIMLKIETRNAKNRNPKISTAINSSSTSVEHSNKE